MKQVLADSCSVYLQTGCDFKEVLPFRRTKTAVVKPWFTTQPLSRVGVKGYEVISLAADFSL